MARSSQTQAPGSHRKTASRTGGNRRRAPERSDVLVSAVISTYLLTHLHHVLQRAEYGAIQDGHKSLAANYAQLRKVLCHEARSLEEVSGSGEEEACGDSERPCGADAA